MQEAEIVEQKVEWPTDGKTVGDEVVYRPYAAAELTVAKEEYTVIEQADIIGIVEK